MTPQERIDEAVKVMEVYQDDNIRILNQLKYDRDRKAGDWTDAKDDLIIGAEKHKHSLSLAIQVLKRCNEEFIENIIYDKGNWETLYAQDINVKNIAQAILESLTKGE